MTLIYPIRQIANSLNVALPCEQRIAVDFQTFDCIAYNVGLLTEHYIRPL